MHTKLLEQQLIEATGSGYRTTSRWHGALARAARYFAEQEESWEDIRLPIIRALFDVFDDQLSDDQLLAAVAFMLALQLGRQP